MSAPRSSESHAALARDAVAELDIAVVGQRWIELFTDYNARVEIVYVEPTVAAILAQNKRRTKPVPENVIFRLLDKLEPPTLAECHALATIV